MPKITCAAKQDLMIATDYETNEEFAVNRLEIMDMEEVYNGRKHRYTRLKKFGSLGGTEYKVKEKIVQLNRRDLRH
jgi:hypothetical protein